MLVWLGVTQLVGAAKKQGVPFLGAHGSTGGRPTPLLYWVSLVLATRHLG